MPFINLKTNINIDDKITLKTKLGELIELIPGKSENWLMIEIDDNKSMYFKGKDDPLMMVEVKIYGKSNPNSLNSLTNSLTSYLSTTYKIQPSRIYVSYFETPFWGYEGENF